MNKKRRARKRFKATSLWNMVVVSFLVHIVLIYLIPAVDVFPPVDRGEYVEIEMTLLDQEEAEQADEKQGQLSDENQVQAFSGGSRATPEVPTSLEPTEPDMVDIHPSDTGHAFSMPERDNVFESPETQNQIHRTFSKPAARLDPDSFAVNFVAVGEGLHKPPPNDQEGRIKADVPQHVMPEDAAYEAKQPYAETFEEHDVVIEPDDSPEFISHAIGELLSNEHRARAPSLRQLTRAKTIMQTDQYPVEQRIETREIVKTAIPNVALPGSNQSPEIDNESITHIDRPETAFVSQAIGHLSASPERVMTFPSLRVQLSRVTSERQLTAMLTKSMIAHTRDVPARALPGLPVMKTFAREIPQDVKEVPASPIHESPPTPFPISRHQEQQEESVARDEVKMRMVPKRDVAEKPFLLSPQSQEALTSRKPTKHEPQQAVVPVVKPIVSDPISKRSLKVPVFSQKNIVYADNSLTSVTQPQRPDPVIAPTPTPAPLVTVKRPKTLERNSLMEKYDGDIALFQHLAAAKRKTSDNGAQASLSLVSNRPAFGISVTKQGSLPKRKEQKKLAEQDDAIHGAKTQKAVERNAEAEIEGPAARREVVYRPLRLPEISLDMEVELRLKFWVLPDGTVGEVVPLQRGDVRLERAAIQYLKSWRFTPAPDSRTAWGIMPIKYTLK